MWVGCFFFALASSTPPGIDKLLVFTGRNMKRGSTYGSQRPAYRGKSANRFCIFPKVKSAESSPGSAPVYLNVYDLTPVNGYVFWAGLGIFHTGIEVYGVEYAFGAHDYPTSGIFEVEPRQCPGFKFRKSILMGRTLLDPLEVRQLMEQQSANYRGYKLTGKRIPRWVNRLARIGSVCNCILPGTLKATRVGHDPDRDFYEDERKRLSSVSFLSSCSVSQREVSISSMSLQSHYQSCLSPP
ncbi:DeSI-like protein [Drosera capensis]